MSAHTHTLGVRDRWTALGENLTERGLEFIDSDCIQLPRHFSSYFAGWRWILKPHSKRPRKAPQSRKRKRTVLQRVDEAKLRSWVLLEITLGSKLIRSKFDEPSSDEEEEEEESRPTTSKAKKALTPANVKATKAAPKRGAAVTRGKGATQTQLT